MLTIRRRGKTFHADMLIGDIRIRGSLGTRNQDAARRLTHRLETALSEGATSSLWPELKTLLPRLTYGRFADYVGVKDQQVPTWNDLREAFTTHMEQRRNIGKLQGSTEERYKVTLREFESFLAAQKITRLQDIAKPLVESFKVWRVERIKKKRYARGATGLVLDAAILHRVFAFAVESEMIVKNRSGWKDGPERTLSTERNHLRRRICRGCGVTREMTNSRSCCFDGPGFADRMPCL